MNGITTNHDGMYQNVTEIRKLNRVEGFEPRKYMRLLENEGQTARYYLDVVYRKLWFRLKHPNGKIVKTLKKLTDQVAIVEARIYLDRNDPEESFISNALAQKYMSADDQFGNKYVELAETAAVGRALADAGFGLQFADLEGEADPNIVDAGVEDADALASKIQHPKETHASGDTEEQLPGQHCMGEYLEPPFGASQFVQGAEHTENPAGKQVSAATYANVPPVIQQKAAADIPATTGQQVNSQMAASNNSQSQTSLSIPASSQEGGASVQEAISRIRRDLPVEQIYKMLNRDMAASLIISAGCFKDKLTLGQLAVEKPQSLSWYVNDYKGPDNLLRASARFLLDAAHAA